MNPVYQTIPHDPDNGLHGNCLSATLASLLHIPIEEVPIFKDDLTWTTQVNEWLRPYGLAYVCIQSAPHIFKEQGISGMYHEVSIPSPRFDGIQHSCVALDSSIIHDPHRGSDSSKATPNTMGLFIALRPWEARTAIIWRGPERNDAKKAEPETERFRAIPVAPETANAFYEIAWEHSQGPDGIMLDMLAAYNDNDRLVNELHATNVALHEADKSIEIGKLQLLDTEAKVSSRNLIIAMLFVLLLVTTYFAVT